MNFQHAEKIRQLIHTSTILNSQEREEWLGLLELMNDKQLVELENILLANVPVMPLEKQPIIDEKEKLRQAEEKKPLTHDLENHPVKTKPKEYQAPHLGHILNMPKVPSKSPVLPGFGRANKKPSFFEKLKDLLKEKELPPGLPDKELSLPSPQIPKQVEIQKSAVAPTPKPVIKAAALPKTESALAHQLAKKILEEKATKTSGLERLPNKINIAGYVEKNFKKSLADVQPNVPQDLNLAEHQPKELPKNQPVVSLNKKTVDSIEELEKLAPQDLSKADVSLLIKSIQNLVRRANVHEIIFHLEKSPLYASYIETGKQLLTLGSSFESLEKGKYLNQKDFEATVDLLRAIQA